MKRALMLIALPTLLMSNNCVTLAPERPAPDFAPRVAAHQHLISPAFAALVGATPMTGADLLRLLDNARIERGVVLSMGYSFSDERKALTDPDRLTAEENDWTSRQVTGSAGRLVGFCSVNPLRETALAEVERCLRLPGIVGLKLHFGNSGVSLRQEAHRERLKEVFRAVERAGGSIVVHMRTRTGTAFGRDDAKLFLDTLLPAAPRTTVQLAHLAGAGPGFPESAQEAFAVFAEAIRRGDPRTRHLIFDQTTVVDSTSTAVDNLRVAKAIQAVGADRVFFGSDMVVGTTLPPGEAWQQFRHSVPLEPADLVKIARHEPSYFGHARARSIGLGRLHHEPLAH